MNNAADIPSQTDAQRQHTDAAEVALRVGLSANYVGKVLRGVRKNDKVERAYKFLLAERAQAKEMFQTEKGA